MDPERKNHLFSALSLLLVLAAAAWSLSLAKSPCLGDYLLNALGIPVWSPADSGPHFTPFFSLPVIIAAVIIAKRHPAGFFSKVSLILSSLMIIFLTVTFLYMA